MKEGDARSVFVSVPLCSLLSRRLRVSNGDETPVRSVSMPRRARARVKPAGT